MYSFLYPPLAWGAMQIIMSEEKKKTKKIAGYIVLSIIALIIISAILGDDTPETVIKSTKTETKEWYAGGTLHKSTAKQWKEANSHNRLATCADYVVNVKEYTSNELMKQDAIALVTCLNNAAIGVEMNEFKTVELAASCLVLMEAQ